MIFVDTSGWLALVDSHDKDHRAVRTLYRRIGSGEFGKQVTTNYVLTEALTLMRRRLGSTHAEAFSRIAEDSREIRTIWIEGALHKEAVQLMIRHSDKPWSVVDCSSFVVMRTLGIDLALTLDDDFSQAGFQVLP